MKIAYKNQALNQAKLQWLSNLRSLCALCYKETGKTANARDVKPKLASGIAAASLSYSGH